MTDPDSSNFPQTNFVVAPFWSNIGVHIGGEISFQVYTSINGSTELDIVSQVITQFNDGDPSFNGTWMLVAQWTEVAETGGDPAMVDYFIPLHLLIVRLFSFTNYYLEQHI